MALYRLAIPLVLFAGCDSAPVGKSEAQRAYERTVDAAVAAVEAAIGEARAADASACRLLPLGENNVGAATFYRVYSVTAGDPALVLALAARVAEIDRAAVAAGVLDYPNGTPPPPAIELRDGRCQFVPVVVVD